MNSSAEIPSCMSCHQSRNTQLSWSHPDAAGVHFQHSYTESELYYHWGLSLNTLTYLCHSWWLFINVASHTHKHQHVLYSKTFCWLFWDDQVGLWQLVLRKKKSFWAGEFAVWSALYRMETNCLHINRTFLSIWIYQGTHDGFLSLSVILKTDDGDTQTWTEYFVRNI